MTERLAQQETKPALPPIETHELQGEFWRFALAQTARERATGARPTEDIVRVSPDLGLFILCDGMGGSARGREAANMVADSLDAYLREKAHHDDDNAALHRLPDEMIEAVRHAQKQLIAAEQAYAEAGQHRGEREMDTTLTAVWLHKLTNGRIIAIVAQVGNSRAYLIGKDRAVRRLTEDQDIMATPEGTKLILGTQETDPAKLADARRRVRDELENASSKDSLSEAARMLYNFRNVTQSVGSLHMTVAVEVYPVPEGSALGLVSDGVFENLGGRRTEQALSMAPLQQPRELVSSVVAEAQRNGHERPKNVITAHPDDITLALITLP